MADEAPELIEKEMDQTRQSLTQKVAALENQVMNTIQTAATTVQDTVESVRSAISETTDTVKQTVAGSADAVQEGVKQMFDITAHVQKNPLAAVGVAAAAGLVTGLVVFRRESAPAGTGTSNGYTSAAYAAPPAYAASAPPAPVASTRPQWLTDLFDHFGDEAKKIGMQALNSFIASVRQNIDKEVPQVVNGLFERYAPKPDDTTKTARTQAYGYGTGV